MRPVLIGVSSRIEKVDRVVFYIRGVGIFSKPHDFRMNVPNTGRQTLLVQPSKEAVAREAGKTIPPFR